MSMDQPAHQHNYTEIGFKKMRAPDEIYKPLKDFYEAYKSRKKLEKWPRGNTYVNNWHAPTHGEFRRSAISARWLPVERRDVEQGTTHN